jgi:hypothetical protein
MDNFSKLYGAGMQGIANQSFAQCLWTGVAIRPVAEGVDVDLTLDAQVEGNVMPDGLFKVMNENRHYKRLVVAMYGKTGEEIDDRKLELMKASWCEKYNVCRVPLKPDLGTFGEDSKLEDKMRLSLEGMINFRPIGINEQNIGSNRGLLTLMRQRVDEHDKRVLSGISRLDVFNSDPNIFYRNLKVP